jgi:8-amino-7-oxononanoate synthase
MSNRYLRHYSSRLDDLERASLRRKLKVSQSATAPLMKINGQDMLTFCSNDYLGLANHPALAKAIQEGIDLYGSGSGASHMISGHSLAHEQLEMALAKTQSGYIPEVQALFISTGYMANLACITGLSASLSSVQDGKAAHMSIYSEELNHASLIDGVRLAQKQNHASIHVYPHQDFTYLENLLQKDSNPFKLIVTDAVFSMDGNIAKIDQLLELAENYDALLMIDDAHGFGVLGHHGHGALEYFGITINDPRASRIIYIGTLGKAAGLSGAFIAAHSSLTEWIMQKGRAYIYTTASPPSIAHGLIKSLEIMSDASHRNNLNSNIAYWKKNLHLKKWQLMPSDTAIQPIVIGSNENTLNAAKALGAAGILVPAIRPPTVPTGSARLRVTLSASHTREQIDSLIKSLHDIEK